MRYPDYTQTSYLYHNEAETDISDIMYFITPMGTCCGQLLLVTIYLLSCSGTLLGTEDLPAQPAALKGVHPVWELVWLYSIFKYG